ncbi:hypothetical protein EDEG_03598 [Edhazardia aedis USNM 41457]|uniref:RNA polymerase III subunit Rpc25 domain-containing protein n=1 Tax=Edhazardia aedis (strain USNM 41457) TaxID=1003232 RepID=J9D264_EDHAE|nr:hypothetical protein EDEG_03598 [Edhazardia aedis USNM 41457]|eukprot:EJW01941.1 hypothetical protein EDEG_03598 [Edhazardia aedis USNM 41457]
MFVELQIEEKVPIHPRHGDIKIYIKDYLASKYSTTFVAEKKMRILLVKSLDKIEDYKIIDGLIIPTVNFTILGFKYFESEIIEAKIRKQSVTDIELQIPFLVPNQKILVKMDCFPDDCDYVSVMPKGGYKKCIVWFWQYNGDKYYFKNGEKVRVRIDKIDPDGMCIYGSFRETGLGPLSWWI